MNLQFKIALMNKAHMEQILEGLTNLELPITFFYLKNGRKQDDWNESVNGLRIELNGVLIFQAHKTSATVRLNKIPEEKRENVLSFLKELDIAKKADYTLGIVLSVIFVLLAVLVIGNAITTNVVFGSIMAGLLLLGAAGTFVLSISSFRMEGNSMITVGLVAWVAGVVAFSPSSLLTIPLLKALLQNKFPFKSTL